MTLMSLVLHLNSIQNINLKKRNKYFQVKNATSMRLLHFLKETVIQHLKLFNIFTFKRSKTAKESILIKIH